jgi:hypothetical protein
MYRKLMQDATATEDWKVSQSKVRVCGGAGYWKAKKKKEGMREAHEVLE